MVVVGTGSTGTGAFVVGTGAGLLTGGACPAGFFGTVATGTGEVAAGAGAAGDGTTGEGSTGDASAEAEALSDALGEGLASVCFGAAGLVLGFGFGAPTAAPIPAQPQHTTTTTATTTRTMRCACPNRRNQYFKRVGNPSGCGGKAVTSTSMRAR